MSLVLKRHPESAAGEDLRLEVEARRPGPGLLLLRYRVTGPVRSLRLPPTAALQRTDGLWRTTCFEVFVGRPGRGYYEWNLSPSTQWAAYGFEAYREGMAAVLEDAKGVSYWGLAHAPGKPDFHHPDSFALDLPLDP